MSFLTSVSTLWNCPVAVHQIFTMGNGSIPLKDRGLLLASTFDFCPSYILWENRKLTKKLKQWQCVETVLGCFFFYIKLTTNCYFQGHVDPTWQTVAGQDLPYHTSRSHVSYHDPPNNTSRSYVSYRNPPNNTSRSHVSYQDLPNNTSRSHVSYHDLTNNTSGCYVSHKDLPNITSISHVSHQSLIPHNKKPNSIKIWAYIG